MTTRVKLTELARALDALGLGPFLAPPADLEAVIELEASPAQPQPHLAVRDSHLRPRLEEMASKGLSNRAMAQAFNEELVLGAHGGQWHSSSIKRLRARLGV